MDRAHQALLSTSSLGKNYWSGAMLVSPLSNTKSVLFLSLKVDIKLLIVQEHSLLSLMVYFL